MERLLLWARCLLCPILLFGLCACGRVGTPPDYRKSAFRAEVSWRSEGAELVAVVEATPSAEASGELRLCVSAPDSLKGITLIRREGTLRVLCGDREIDGSGFEGLFFGALALMPEGALTAVCETTLQGERVLYAEIISNHEETEEKRYELYLEPETGIPRRIVCRGQTLEIRSFASMG